MAENVVESTVGNIIGNTIGKRYDLTHARNEHPNILILAVEILMPTLM